MSTRARRPTAGRRRDIFVADRDAPAGMMMMAVAGRIRKTLASTMSSRKPTTRDAGRETSRDDDTGENTASRRARRRRGTVADRDATTTIMMMNHDAGTREAFSDVASSKLHDARGQRASATRARERSTRGRGKMIDENVRVDTVECARADATTVDEEGARWARRHPTERAGAWAGKRGTRVPAEAGAAVERWMTFEEGDEDDDDDDEDAVVMKEDGSVTTTTTTVPMAWCGSTNANATANATNAVEPEAPATDEAWDVINSFPIVRGDMVMCEGDGEHYSYGVVDVPFIPPEFIERPSAEEAESDNEAEEDEEEDARRFSQAIRESSLLCEDDDAFDDDVGAPVDFISEPVAFAARREARELAAAARVPGIDFMVKSGALLCDEDYDAKDVHLECSAMTNVSDLEGEAEHFATAADGRVFRVSQALVTPKSSEQLAKGHGKHRLEDSANRGGNDSEDSDAELVAQSTRKAVPGKKNLATKRKRRPDAPIRRAKAAKKEKGSGVRATDIYVMANGKRQRRGCLHCGTVKTPQWRMGPEGKKTLCNACGVRFMKGIL